MSEPAEVTPEVVTLSPTIKIRSKNVGRKGLPYNEERHILHALYPFEGACISWQLWV